MNARPLDDQTDLPLRVSPASESERSAEALVAWARSERAWLEDRLNTHGGVLLRGFAVGSAEQFEQVCRAIEPELMGYAGGESPRSLVSGGVYTSTEYPSHLEISLHNEMSYARAWPARIFFFCAETASEGGETQIADGRRVLAGLDPSVRRRFVEKQVMYVRNLGDGTGIGRSWQETFETQDRSEAEAACARDGVDFEWTAFGLRTRAVRPAVVRHPATGDEVWFNQADQSHVSSRGERAQRSLLRAMAEEDLPRHAYFGDGSPIETADLDHVRSVQRGLEVVFAWQRGDVLVLDNVLTSHGRKPFQGSRRVLVAMG